nr:MAG TPA: hypothetical protein [Caudoviricetes sp.]
MLIVWPENNLGANCQHVNFQNSRRFKSLKFWEIPRLRITEICEICGHIGVCIYIHIYG